MGALLGGFMKMFGGAMGGAAGGGGGASMMMKGPAMGGWPGAGGAAGGGMGGLPGTSFGQKFSTMKGMSGPSSGAGGGKTGLSAYHNAPDMSQPQDLMQTLMHLNSLAQNQPKRTPYQGIQNPYLQQLINSGYGGR